MNKAAVRTEAEEPDCNWTHREVCTLFVKAIGTITVYSLDGKIYPVGYFRPGKEKVIHWLTRYLDLEDRRFLIKACAHIHRRKSKLAEMTDKDFVQTLGYKTASGVWKRRKRLCEKVAELLKRDRIPRFKL
jgi:hypothetical protein